MHYTLWQHVDESVCRLCVCIMSTLDTCAPVPFASYHVYLGKRCKYTLSTCARTPPTQVIGAYLDQSTFSVSLIIECLFPRATCSNVVIQINHNRKIIIKMNHWERLLIGAQSVVSRIKMLFIWRNGQSVNE